MTRVLTVGVATWDHLWRVRAIPTSGTKVMASDHVEVGGGMAASAAVAVARLGGQASYWGRLGDDAIAARILDDLAREKVDATVRRYPGHRTGITSVLVDEQGERLIVPFYDPTLPVTPDWLPLDQVAAFDAVHCDARWPDGAAAVLAKANRIAMFDGDIAAPEILDRLTRLATHPVFSAPGLRRFTGHDDLATALSAVTAPRAVLIGVSDGPHGCLWRDADGLHHAPAPSVTARDTLAAGDVFHGALVLALAEGQPVSRAMRFACVAAALKCAVFGGRTGAPTRDRVEALL